VDYHSVPAVNGSKVAAWCGLFYICTVVLLFRIWLGVFRICSGASCPARIPKLRCEPQVGRGVDLVSSQRGVELWGFAATAAARRAVAELVARLLATHSPYSPWDLDCGTQIDR
jgi:hypothetical protein